tara:strand:- start:293 stop:520 length:228 start_codon:yes stop_codon:yes gene_type:complete
MKVVTLDEDNDIVVRTKKYKQAIDYCLKWFELHEINAFEDDKSVYIEAYNFELELSSAEVFYRADLYKSISEEVI